MPCNTQLLLTSTKGYYRGTAIPLWRMNTARNYVELWNYYLHSNYYHHELYWFLIFLQGHAISYSTSNERQKFSGRRGSRIKHLSSTSVVLLSLRIILTRSDRNSPSSWLCPPLMKSLNPLKLLFFLPFVSAEIQKSWINLVLTFDSFSSENFFSTEQFNPLFTSIIYCL